MARTATYSRRRGELETYFDRTASEAWAKLTSDAPVSGIRATVRAGRDEMRRTLMGWLPDDMNGMRLLDAGCGAGQLSVEAARRGADVVGVDLSPTLLDLARERYAAEPLKGTIAFHAGDMFDPDFGEFDYCVAMDSLIHYDMQDILRVLSGFAGRTRHAMAVTIAPKTPLLTVMHGVGKFFPRSDRAPAIQPVSIGKLQKELARTPRLDAWTNSDDCQIQSGFYTSHALFLKRQS